MLNASIVCRFRWESDWVYTAVETAAAGRLPAESYRIAGEIMLARTFLKPHLK
jgi:hypothetical protein